MESRFTKLLLRVILTVLSLHIILFANAKSEWAVKSLKSQNKIEASLPFTKSSMLGSHNSYNTTAYGVSSWFANQTLTMSAQLDLGVESIEIDAHKYNGDIRMCHALDNHFGCTFNAPTLLKGLQEIQSWVERNRDKVIFVYIEDHTDKWHDKLNEIIQKTIGSYVYRSGGYFYIPRNLSKEKVLANGKNIILIKDGAKSENAELLKTVYPTFSPMKRAWEDTVFGSTHIFQPGDIRKEFLAGKNLVTVDKLTRTSWKIEDAIWSWKVNEPQSWGTGKNCAVIDEDGRWKSEECGKEYQFACLNSTNDTWELTGYGVWQDGVDTCTETLGEDYQFATPRSMLENKALYETTGGETVWINQSNGDTTPVKPEPLPINGFEVTSIQHQASNLGKYFNFNIEDVNNALGREMKYGEKINVTNTRSKKTAQVVIWDKSSRGVSGEGHGRYTTNPSNGDWQVGDVVVFERKDSINVRSLLKNQSQLANNINNEEFLVNLFKQYKKITLKIANGFWVRQINLPKDTTIIAGSVMEISRTAAWGTNFEGKFNFVKNELYTFTYNGSTWDITKSFGDKFITTNGLSFPQSTLNNFSVKNIEATLSGAWMGGSYKATIDYLGENKFAAYLNTPQHAKVVEFQISNGKIKTTRAKYRFGKYDRNAKDYRNVAIATAKNNGAYGIYKVKVKYSLD